MLLLHFAWVVDDAKCIVVTRVYVSVCLSAAACPHYCTDPDVTWGSGRGCPLVVHYWADLQSVHGLRCCGNITRTRNVSEHMLVLALRLGSLANMFKKTSKFNVPLTNLLQLLGDFIHRPQTFVHLSSQLGNSDPKPLLWSPKKSLNYTLSHNVQFVCWWIFTIGTVYQLSQCSLQFRLAVYIRVLSSEYWNSFAGSLWLSRVLSLAWFSRQ